MTIKLASNENEGKIRQKDIYNFSVNEEKREVEKGSKIGPDSCV
jgi:hypothetical protein